MNTAPRNVAAFLEASGDALLGQLSASLNLEVQWWIKVVLSGSYPVPDKMCPATAPYTGPRNCSAQVDLSVASRMGCSCNLATMATLSRIILDCCRSFMRIPAIGSTARAALLIKAMSYTE